MARNLFVEVRNSLLDALDKIISITLRKVIELALIMVAKRL